MHFKNGVAGKKLVLNDDVHQVWFCCIVGLMFVKFGFFCLQFYAADVAHGNGSADDSEHAERIGTGIAVGNGR